MSTARDNNKDQFSNEALFLLYAGKDFSKWNIAIGTHVIEIEEGRGEIVCMRKSNIHGVVFCVRFDNSPENDQEYTPVALEKGTIVFSEVSREFEEMKPLMVDKFLEEQKRLEEEKRRKEIKEEEKSALLHCKELCTKYGVLVSQLDTSVGLLYVILLKLEGKETLTQEDLGYLEKRKAFYAMAEYYKQQTRQSQPNLWDYPKAAKYYRKAEKPIEALEISEGVKPSDPKIYSAILVSRGAAYRDLKNLPRAESYAVKALNFNSRSFYAYNLLGAIAYQLGDPEKGEKYFHKAIQLGSRPQVIDAAIRDAMQRADQKEKLTTARYLLNKDPKRYGWAKYYLNGGNK